MSKVDKGLLESGIEVTLEEPLVHGRWSWLVVGPISISMSLEASEVFEETSFVGCAAAFGLCGRTLVSRHEEVEGCGSNRLLSRFCLGNFPK